MTNDLLMNGANGALPEHLQGTSDDTFGEGMDGNSFPRLSFKSNRFRLRQGDDEAVLPGTELNIIILRDYPAISRIFFASAYDPDSTDHKPDCASADGEHPIATITNPQANACATCPQNEKGSVITDDGRKSRACGFYKRLVALVEGYEDVGPVIMDVKAMSLFGDSKPEENLWSLKSYFQRLKKNNMSPFHMVTELSFDLDSSVPKLFFRPTEYVKKATFVQYVTPLISTPDGKDQLALMVDTASVQVEGADDASGFKDKLLESNKPDYMEDAVAAGDVISGPTNPGRLSAVPEPEPEPIDELAAMKAKVAALEAEAKGKVPELSPQQKAAKTRAANKAKKEAAAAKEKAVQDAAQAMAETDAGTEQEVAGSGFSDELEDALADYGFDS